jgi:hypothetical protein
MVLGYGDNLYLESWGFHIGEDSSQGLQVHSPEDLDLNFIYHTITLISFLALFS